MKLFNPLIKRALSACAFSAVAASGMAQDQTKDSAPVAASEQAALQKEQAQLIKQASVDPDKLAARADAIKLRRQRAQQDASVEDPVQEALRQRTQKALVAAETDDQRQDILAEHQALTEAIQAQARLKKISDKKTQDKAGSKTQ